MVCHRSEGKLKQNETVYQIRKRGDERRKGRRKEEEEEEEEGKRRPREEKVSDHSSEKGEAVSCLSAKLGMTSMLSRHCGVGKTWNLSFHTPPRFMRFINLYGFL